ncbi:MULTISPECIES: glycoside hydrolase family 15 protein [unclassified Kitasatospora]|uniref:glycoside hydrolase family 15 protein n=1 Tax=unclassified Kitasatospora TaxID=2633591 RepID=UPI00070B5691|nr:MULTISPECIES: glycoside hydrolase family 15 protein [unclassified Kitasatospora]KQV20840.1 glucoamylase [Kitasatospora sp. Root107]KRB60504.1 glucoamylase [Kitasatospora sp. Root187]
MATASALLEDHALIGNTRSAALVRTDGTVSWLCLPDFDSAAPLAALVGRGTHGFWSVAPAAYTGRAATRRAYVGNSLVLQQEWHTPSGSVRVTDFMPTTQGPDGQPVPRLVRIVEGLRGRVAMASRIRIRPGYGATTPLLRRHFQQGVDRLSAVAGADALWLDGPAHTATRRPTNRSQRADFTASPGSRTAFTLTWNPSHLPAPELANAEMELEETLYFWERFAQRSIATGVHQGAVLRSLAVLKALTFSPTGAVVAAPTTSLPEEIGGGRNWDYRFCWLRDSALTITTLVRAGHTEEARAWREWLLRALAGDPGDLQIMYGIRGERDLDERELSHLPGYENSRPVRIGNGAAAQVQLDVFGEVAIALAAAEDAGLEADEQVDQLLLNLVRTLAGRWREPDAGIWEIRGPKRHFTHSKVMAWAAADRILAMLTRRPDTPQVVLRELAELRDAIHHDVLDNGFDEELGTFTQYYGGQELDASLLLIPAVGFLPADDKRVIATIEAIQRELATDDALVLRYRTFDDPGGDVDGLTGHEGAFLACSFWLVDALALIGRTDEAHQLLERLLAIGNELGLFAEEWDPVARRQLGNYPQGFTHLALADTCRTLTTTAHAAALPGPRTAPAPVPVSA